MSEARWYDKPMDNSAWVAKHLADRETEWRGRFNWLNSERVSARDLLGALGPAAEIVQFDLSNVASFQDLISLMRVTFPDCDWLVASAEAFCEALGILVEDAPSQRLCMLFDASNMAPWPNLELAIGALIAAALEQQVMSDLAGSDKTGLELSVFWLCPSAALPSLTWHGMEGLSISGIRSGAEVKRVQEWKQ